MSQLQITNQMYYSQFSSISETLPLNQKDRFLVIAGLFGLLMGASYNSNPQLVKVGSQLAPIPFFSTRLRDLRG